MSYTGPFKSNFHISEVIAVFESTAALWYKWHLILLRKITHFKFWFGNTCDTNLDQWTAGSEDKNEFPSWTERNFPGAASRTLAWVGDVSVWHKNVTAVIVQPTEKTNQIVKHFDSKVNFFRQTKIPPWRIAFGISFHTGGVWNKQTKKNWDSLLNASHQVKT